MRHTFLSAKEALQSVLPIAAIVLLLSITYADLDAGVLVLFLFGTILLIAGMSFFTMGSGISMEPLGEVLSFNKEKITDGGDGAMKNEHHNNLIVISVNEGYSGDVMQAARKAGATGGTVIKGRLADIEQFAHVAKNEINGERELIFILAPLETGKRIMEEVNKEFGINSVANGMTFAIPTEKAYKI